MIRPYEIFIGLRYTRAPQRHRLISFISLVSIVAIAIGIAALITILSVMNGFGNEVRSRILSFISHVTITEPSGRLQDWQGLGERVKNLPHVKAFAPYISGQALVARGNSVSGVMVSGILPEHERHVSEIHNKLVSGQFEALKSGEFGVIVGSSIAVKLGLDVNSQVSLVVPQAQPTPTGLLPRFKRFTVVGVFDADMHEYDAGMVLIHLDDAAKLYQLPGYVDGLRLHLDDVDLAPRVARDVENTVGPEYVVSDWTRKHNVWFQALAMEKTVMFVILSLIVAVAMFNVISTLVVVVNEKKADIAILRTLGASPKSILAIFLFQGSFIGVVGTVAGVVAGVLLALNVSAIVRGMERLFGTHYISPEVYLIRGLPSDLQWGDVATICIVSLTLSLLSTLYPAWRASQMQPAEALRYE
jgi:lipoprotein-releasing system permease protein